MSRKLQEATSRVITVRRSVDNANIQARADAEEAERLRGQLRSAAEAQAAAVREHDTAKDEHEVAVWERNVAVLGLNTADKSVEDARRERDAARGELQGKTLTLLPLFK